MKEKKMTNLEMLIWGIAHIAENHGFKFSVDYEEDGQVCVYGGCNVPTLCDVKMLCGDVGIDSDEYVYANDCGIDVEIPYDWFEKKANKIFKGDEFWRRKC